MNTSFRQSMAWLHTWTGLVVGWVLFFVFVTGSTGYMQYEISRWMQPELPLQRQPDQLPAVPAMIDTALTRLKAEAPDANFWIITLPHQGAEPRGWQPLSIGWQDRTHSGAAWQVTEQVLDPDSGAIQPAPTPRDTSGGFGLYRMHYALHYIPGQTAYYLVGICTMLMLLALITGVITHKKIITDFFTFRPGKGQRSWLDAHNVVSVMSLPFFVMITYSGLVFFVTTYMPAPVIVAFGPGQAGIDRYLDSRYSPLPTAYDPARVETARVTDAVARAEAAWGAGRVAQISIEHRHDAEPFIELLGIPGDRVGGLGLPQMRVHAVTGAPLPPADARGPVARTERVLFDLHEGLFAGWVLRWVYFGSGLLGAAVIATGLVLWTVKRRQKHVRGATAAERFGLRLVEVLNAGTIIGLPIGIAAFFLANRLLPVQMDQRAAWEFHALFAVWGWTFLWASLRPLKRAWIDLCWLACAASLAVPLVNALTTERHLGITLPAGDLALAGVDLTWLAFAAVFARIAMRLTQLWAVAQAPVAATLRGGHAHEPAE